MSDDASLAGLRERLVAEVQATSGIRDERIAAALRDVPRHLFLPHLPPEDAYLDDAIVTKRDAEGQPISSSSQPAIMAIMLDQLDLAPGQRVLEIGAGTGYNAALIRHIVGPYGHRGQRRHPIQPGRGGPRAPGQRRLPGRHGGRRGRRGRLPARRAVRPGDRHCRVSDLAPAWLHQTGPGARIVVPLDVRGSQLAVAFERAAPAQAGGAGHWVSRSAAPCGFMRMRGSLAGPERTVLQPGLSVLLPDGLMLADGHEVDGAALAAFLDGPPAEFATGVQASSLKVFWGLNLWLAASDRRSCEVAEDGPRSSSRRTGAARGSPGRRCTGRGCWPRPGSWIPAVSPCSTADQPRPASSRWRWPGSARTARTSARPRRTRAGLGPAGSPARRGCMWTPTRDPRPTSHAPASDALRIERAATRFVVYHT